MQRHFAVRQQRVSIVGGFVNPRFGAETEVGFVEEKNMLDVELLSANRRQPGRRVEFQKNSRQLEATTVLSVAT
jgi:hypothetical protein